jgi:flagellar protein FlaJ
MNFKSLTGAFGAKSEGKIPFSGIFESIRKKFNRFVLNKRMGADLLFTITYMASITTAQATRPEIFAYTAAREEYVSSQYFKKVEFFVKRWNFSYVSGLVTIAERVDNNMLRSMLNRYANSIESGVPDEDFLRRELATIRSVYRNTYEQGLEMLKKWGDAYVAMLFSGSLVGIIIMMSIAIFAPTDIQGTLRMSYMIVIGISIFGLYTMFTAVPSDLKTHNLPTGSKEQGIIRRLEGRILPSCLLVVMVLAMLQLTGLVKDVYGLAMLVLGIMLLPLGIIGYLDDSHIVMRDAEFPTFIRSLGAVMGGKGTSITHALREIDIKSLETLEPLIRAVYSKLNLGLDEKQSWEKFIAESGSNLISKYLNIFRDSVELGGTADRIGEIVGSSMLEQVLLREKRSTISMGFVVLLIPMHALMVSIFLFLFHILLTMSNAIQNVIGSLGPTGSGAFGAGSVSGALGGGMNLFVSFPEGEMTVYVIIMITILAVANILAGKIVMGGDRYIFYFFASIILAITGIIYIAAPILVSTFFAIPTFAGV